MTDFLNTWHWKMMAHWPVRSQIAFLASLCGLIGLLVYRLDLRPHQEQLQHIQAIQEKLRQDYQENSDEITHLDTYREEIQKMTDRFGDLLHQFPDINPVSDWLEEISQAGITTQVSLQSMQLKSEESNDRHTAHPIEIAAQGDYHQLGHFISTLANGPHLITVSELSMEANQPTDQQTPGRLNLLLVAKSHQYTASPSDPESTPEPNWSGFLEWTPQPAVTYHADHLKNPFEPLRKEERLLPSSPILLDSIDAKPEPIPLKTAFIRIYYAKAAEIAALLQDPKNTLLSMRGRLSVDARTNTLILLDHPETIGQIREMIKQLDVPVEQVQIEARVIEVKKNVEDALGIRWGLTRRSHHAPVQASSTPSALARHHQLNVALPLPNTWTNTGKLGIAMAKLPHGTLLDLELSALQSENVVHLISSPRLVTANQSEATIEQGQEIPYQQATMSGATHIAFKKAVLSLKVTPRITPDRRIILNLEVHNDGKSTDAFNHVPVIDTHRIHTSVWVENGQTLVLGGIYKRDKENRVHRVPFFSELPLIGYFFKDKDDLDTRDEIIVFITPKIMSGSLTVG